MAATSALLAPGGNFMKAVREISKGDVPLDVASIRDKRDVLRFPPSPILQNGDPLFTRNPAGRFTTKSAKFTKASSKAPILFHKTISSGLSARKNVDILSAMTTVALALKDEDQDFIQEAVNSGRFFSESEVVAEALSEQRRQSFPVGILSEMDAEHPTVLRGRSESNPTGFHLSRLRPRPPRPRKCSSECDNRRRVRDRRESIPCAWRYGRACAARFPRHRGRRKRNPASPHGKECGARFRVGV